MVAGRGGRGIYRLRLGDAGRYGRGGESPGEEDKVSVWTREEAAGMLRLCSVGGCQRAHYARGWCKLHYGRWRAWGDPLGRSDALEDRFWPKVVALSSGCWEWRGARGSHGYGIIRVGPVAPRHYVRAHRVSYEMLVGPVPEGRELDHLCRNPPCVNPSHLEAVTHRENVRRGVSAAAQHARATHCPQGHAYDEANTMRSVEGRHCRACRTARLLRYRVKLRVAALARTQGAGHAVDP